MRQTPRFPNRLSVLSRSNCVAFAPLSSDAIRLFVDDFSFVSQAQPFSSYLFSCRLL